MATAEQKTAALVKHAENLEKVRDQAAKEFPEAQSSTPTMDRIINWGKSHKEKVAKAEKEAGAKSGKKASMKKIHEESLAEAEEAGISVGDVEE